MKYNWLFDFQTKSRRNAVGRNLKKGSTQLQKVYQRVGTRTSPFLTVTFGYFWSLKSTMKGRGNSKIQKPILNILKQACPELDSVFLLVEVR